MKEKLVIMIELFGILFSKTATAGDEEVPTNKPRHEPAQGRTHALTG
ncbi:MAG: hypothetical protein I3J02_01295 [Prevotella sp.]|nr:hypothetical protein [Prevotella sp.]